MPLPTTMIAADYAVSACFTDSRGIYVNLYAPAQVAWTQNNVRCGLSIETDYPYSAGVVMTLGLTPEQQDLSDAVAQFASRHAPIAATRETFGALAAGRLPGWWDALVANGFHAVHLPERLGGQGGREQGADELVVVLVLGQAIATRPEAVDGAVFDQQPDIVQHTLWERQSGCGQKTTHAGSLLTLSLVGPHPIHCAGSVATDQLPFMTGTPISSARGSLWVFGSCARSASNWRARLIQSWMAMSYWASTFSSQ